jgi:putative flippase GtrA
MPSFSSLRVWGRMNIVLVPIIAWLLAIAYTHFEELISRKNASQTAKRSSRTPIYVLSGAYAAIIIIQVYLFRNKLYDYYWTEYFKYLSSKEDLFIKYGLIAFFISFFLLMLASKIRFQSSQTLAVILSGLILFSALDMRSSGSGMWIYPSPIKTTNRSRVNVAQMNLESFTIPRIDEQATVSLSSTFSIGTIENWYFNRYVQFLERTNNELNARRQLMGMVDGRKLYFSQSINHPTIQAFLDDAAQFKDFERVISYTGDELTLAVRTPTEGYLSFIDNWDGDWKVAVDSKPTPIELLFGTFKSVRLVPGEHRVIFSYRPGFSPVSQ